MRYHRDEGYGAGSTSASVPRSTSWSAAHTTPSPSTLDLTGTAADHLPTIRPNGLAWALALVVPFWVLLAIAIIVIS